ncbi:MAG: DNA polymerase III subunit alpha, partial [Actinobacteria bacterium]|nr:DNA polymerase III subunit alpha [Actinomycetota bacterium]
ESERVDLDALAPFDDPATYDLIAKAATLGCFQIESPGQRELVAKFSPETFDDIIIDISLFRPGPVKSDMITPFLDARQGWKEPVYPHPDVEPVLSETCGVVVFHEQIIKLISVATGCSLAQGDEARRALGDQEGQETVRRWFVPQALRHGYSPELVERLWEILASFASFGFCKAHAAAFALPTYQSAWLKAHYPAHFLAGVLTHDPGMYPKRLLLDEARRLGVAILGLDVNASEKGYRVERLGEGDALVEVAAPSTPPPRRRETPPLADMRGLEARLGPGAGLPDGRPWGIWMSLADVAGISDAEVSRIVAGRPYSSLTDFWNRTGVAQPVVERLILAGGFDRVYGIGRSLPVGDRGRVTRRDLLLSLADLGRMARVDARATRARGVRAAVRTPRLVSDDPRDRAKLQSQATAPTGSPEVQQPLDFTTGAVDVPASGLPEMTDAERVTAELGILGIDVSDHVVARHRRLFAALGVTPAADLLSHGSGAELLVAGVKVATQTPGVRSGRRVIFLTLDDTTGLSDATFFEDVQGPYAATVFASWLLVVRGVMRRTGPRGRSLRATAAWDLTVLQAAWDAELDRTGSEDAALAAVEQLMAVVPAGYSLVGELLPEPGAEDDRGDADAQQHGRAGGMGQRRVLVHASGAMQSPYADVRPSGLSPADAPRKLWHSSPNSSGR